MVLPPPGLSRGALVNAFCSRSVAQPRTGLPQNSFRVSVRTQPFRANCFGSFAAKSLLCSRTQGWRLAMVKINMRRLLAERTPLRVVAVRACETNRGILRREDFWFIVATRSEDETEIRTGQSAGRTSYKGH